MSATIKKGSRIRQGIDDYLQSRRVLSISNTLLAVSCVLLALSTFSTRTEIIAVPPHMNDEMRISGNRANEVYNLGWATFIASQAGNINEANHVFVLDMLIEFLSPNLRAQVEESLRTEVQLLVGRGAEQSFSVENAVYDPVANMAWIWGRREIRIPGVQPRRSRWTYEIRVEPNGGNPRITFLNAYEGTPQRRNRPEFQEFNPFITHEHELRIEQVDANAPVRARQFPVNAAPAVTIDLTTGDEEEVQNHE